MRQFSTSQTQNHMIIVDYATIQHFSSAECGRNVYLGAQHRSRHTRHADVCMYTVLCLLAYCTRTCVPAACAILGEVSEQGNVLDRVLPEEEPHRLAGLACRNATSAVQSTLPTCVCPEPVLANVRLFRVKNGRFGQKRSVPAP